MASFKERFKEKSSMVGKEGEHAMLSPVPSCSTGPATSGARPGRGAIQRDVPAQHLPAAVGGSPPNSQSPTMQPLSLIPRRSSIGCVSSPPMAAVGQQHQVPLTNNGGGSSQVVFGSQHNSASSFGVGTSPQQHGAPAPGFATPLAFQPTGIMPSSRPQPLVPTQAKVVAHADKDTVAKRTPNVGGGVGSYNYSAAAASVPRQTEENAVRTQQDNPKNVIQFGRRAGSTDPSPVAGPSNTGRRAMRNQAAQQRRQSDELVEERPRTDPSGNQQPVQYKPYGVADYRRMKQDLEKRTSGGLGPSDTDEQRAAALRTQKQKEYAENIKRINAAILRTAVGPTDGSPHTSCDDLRDDVSPRTGRAIPVQPPPPEVIEKLQRRERAFQYAKNVPRPKLRIPETKPDDPSTLTHAGGEADGRHHMTDAEQQTRLDKERQLADLEARHAQDQQMVENLKKQLRI